MSVTTLTREEFSENASRAAEAADHGPVFITDHGHPKHVLLSFDAYASLSKRPVSLADAIAMPDGSDIELDIPARRGPAARPVAFE